jgi:DNA-binding XRE family transcriptional regulator
MRSGSLAVELPQWSFADRIRKIRRDVLGVDQTEFAQRLGVTRQAYAAWEAGRNEPRTILAVARKVELMSGVPAAWLLGVDSPTPGTGVPTEGTTGRYVDPSSARSPRLSLVTPLDGTYPDVGVQYGSSVPSAGAEGTRAHDPYHGVGKSAWPYGADSAREVNDAHAA